VGAYTPDTAGSGGIGDLFFAPRRWPAAGASGLVDAAWGDLYAISARSAQAPRVCLLVCGVARAAEAAGWGWVP